MKYITTFFAKFSKDPAKRLLVLTEQQLYDAKMELIQNSQQKLYIDSMLDYNRNRVDLLMSMVAKLKGPEDAENSSLTRTSNTSDIRNLSKFVAS